MIVGLQVGAVDALLVGRTLDALVDYCTRYYLAHPNAPRVDEAGVRYAPDLPSDAVVLVAPDQWGDGPVSCGSAAGAFVGWMHAHMPNAGWRARYLLLGDKQTTQGRVATWHAYAMLPGRTVWDPMKELRR